jgi:hypothetical protein
MKPIKTLSLLFTFCLVWALSPLPLTAGDYLTPPGPPGSEVARMKTLNQVEPRQLIERIPCTITNPGSYYLAQNMYATSSIVGITVRSSDVQIDLNGFALIGTTNSLDGILIDGTNENITIRNGSIRKWDGFGINGKNANDGSVVEVKANRNGLGGILYGEGAMIARCAAFGNGYKAPLPPDFMSDNPDQDSDDDGMPDSFEQVIIDFSTTDPINTLADVWPWYDVQWDPLTNHPVIHWDFDQDTMENHMESMDGTDPTDPDDNSMNNYMPMDTDFDGLDDRWEMNIVSNLAAAEIQNINDVWPWRDPVVDDPPGTFSDLHWDADQDGYENMQEFQGGTDPLDPGDVPTNATQSEYAGYTNPPTDTLYEKFEDPEDEPSDDGIRVAGFSTIKDCKSRKNRGSGIYAGNASQIHSCISAGNMVDGIRATSYATVQNCTVARNNKDGITIGNKCRVVENNCGQNGDLNPSGTGQPEGAGIRIVGSGNRVEDNNVSGNAIGIRVDNAYETAMQATGGNLIMGNSSVDNWGGAFDLSSGDFMGGEYYQGDVGAPTNATTDAMMNANNPFSNFSF